VANRLSTLISAVVAGLETLVDAGTLASVRRGVLNPLTEPTGGLPVAAVMVDDPRAEAGPPGGEAWQAVLYVAVACRSVAATPKDQTLLDLVAEVDAALAAVRTGGSAGGLVGSCRWETWPFGLADRADSVAPETLAAVGRVEVKVDGGLKTD